MLMDNDEFDKTYKFTKDELKKVDVTDKENNEYIE
jgi:hypothetical protein